MPTRRGPGKEKKGGEKAKERKSADLNWRKGKLFTKALVLLPSIPAPKLLLLRTQDGGNHEQFNHRQRKTYALLPYAVFHSGGTVGRSPREINGPGAGLTSSSFDKKISAGFALLDINENEKKGKRK